MQISLHNIGNVKKADIKLDGITILSGEDSSGGVSSVYKALYSVVDSLHNLEGKVEYTCNEFLANALGEVDYRILQFPGAFRAISEYLREHKYSCFDKGNIPELKSIIESKLISFDPNGCCEIKVNVSDEDVMKVIDDCNRIMETDDIDFIKYILTKHFCEEFGSNLVNPLIGGSGAVKLNLGGTQITLTAEKEHVVEVEGICSSARDVIYYDNPFVMDELKHEQQWWDLGTNHNECMQKHLLYSKKCESVAVKTLKMLNEIIPGHLDRVGMSGFQYHVSYNEDTVEVRNLPAGIKTLLILKTLIEGGSLGYGGILILENPEVYLHPEWQLKFAEIIVLLQKELNLHILINTNSPYFLRALQVFGGKYEIADKCKYYLAENEKDGIVIEDVSNNIEKIYSQLASPLQELESLRCSSVMDLF